MNRCRSMQEAQNEMQFTLSSPKRERQKSCLNALMRKRGGGGGGGEGGGEGGREKEREREIECICPVFNSKAEIKYTLWFSLMYFS